MANGYQALKANQSGFYNVANGFKALFSNTGGYYNTANGTLTLFNNTGDANVATGFEALRSNTSGFGNVANGYRALFNHTTGAGNVAIGTNALNSDTTGSYNTAMGNNANVSTGNLTNATAIGANAEVSQSNSLVLGSIAGVNGASSDVHVGIGTTAPDTTLHVVGNIKMEDGSELAGYIPVSDVNGVMTWTDPTTITAANDLNLASDILTLTSPATGGNQVDLSVYLGQHRQPDT